MTPNCRALATVLFLAASSCFAQDTKPAPKAQPPAAAAPQQGGAQPARKFGLDKPKPRTPGAIRVATYNIENLFDDKNDPTLTGRYEDEEMTKPEPDLKAAAAAIKAIDADVIALQEIESKEALLWFRDLYLKDLGYEHVVSIEAGDERGIEQAVISRFPIVESKNWVGLELGGVHPEKWGKQDNENAGKKITYHRSPLMVTVRVPGDSAAAGTPGAPYELTLVAVHHKAGRDGEYWREKEAAKTVELLADMQKAAPERNIIWLGDFNATNADPSMKVVAAAGWFDVFGDQKAPAGGRNDATIISHASGRIIDHILLSPAARPEFVVGSNFVLGTSIKGREGYASDHYPVVIDLIPKEGGSKSNE